MIGSKRRTMLLAVPCLGWIAVFHLLPLVSMAGMSVSSGSLESGYRLGWRFENWSEALSAFSPQLVRSIGFAGAATALAVAIGYPIAYRMALGGRRTRTFLWAAVVLPFLAPYLVRTLAWETILADDGPVAAVARAAGMLGPGGRLLATGGAVVGALAYNYLPFMILPLYASLEQLDRSVLEAAGDLYAGPVHRFRTVVLPLSMPGLLAGGVLTFVPAAGDFVNAGLLGGPRQTMVGSVIASRLLVVLDHPSAAALGLMLTAGLVLAAFVYLRLPGEAAP